VKVRRKKKRPQETPGAQEDSMDVAAFLTHNRPSKPPPGTGRGRTLGPLAVALEDAERRAASGEWEDAGARAFVGLYAMCHRMVYHVDAGDLTDTRTFQAATRLAAGALHRYFGDDKDDLVEFIKWIWEREKGREEWAAREGKDRGRLNVRLQFSATLVTDYRVDQSRRKRSRKVRR